MSTTAQVLPTVPTLSGRSISSDAEVFTRNLNRYPFEVQHSLSANPLFTVPSIIELLSKVEARKNPHRGHGDVYFNVGVEDPGLKVAQSEKPAVNPAELMRSIQESKAWIILEHVEREDGYREVLQKCICDLLEMTGKEMLDKVKWFDAILFVTSPHRHTHYHVDRECAWLLQLHGEKEIHLFDKNDKEVLPDDELERFWTVDNGAGTYKPQFEDRAHVFNMKPGTGVHIPVNCPHWLKNGSEVSVSMNVNFQFRDEIWGNIFKANHYLRRFGMKPSSPGLHPVRDKVKSLAYTAVQSLNHMRTGYQSVPPEAREEVKRIHEMMKAN